MDPEIVPIAAHRRGPRSDRTGGLCPTIVADHMPIMPAQPVLMGL
jgi:hypothetical protein